MRIAGAILIWIVFVGGLGWYMNQRELPVSPSQASQPTPSMDQVYAMEIISTSDLGPDPFSIALENDAEIPTLRVRMGNQELLRQTSTISAGKPVIIPSINGLVPGTNEVFVEAGPAISGPDTPFAIHIRILQDEIPIAEHTFWPGPGMKIQDSFQFEVHPFHQE